MRVLLVEDDDGFASALIDALEAHGHRMTRCCRGEDALIAHRHRDAELVLLDLRLPGIDGFEVLCRLRQVSKVPVIVLTTYDDEGLAVRALHCGANDYVVKRGRQRELLARMYAATRPSSAHGDPAQRIVRVADVCVDLDARTVEVAGEPVTFTTKEFEVLAVLARRAGTPVSRRQIMDEVWGNALVKYSRCLDVHVVSMRAKLDRPDLLHTIRGFGYRFG